MSETKPSTVPIAPRIIRISFFAALGVAFILWALAMATFAGWRGLQVSGVPNYLAVVLLIFCVVLGVAAVLVRRGSSWACFIPIGCLLALAAVWVRDSLSGTVSVIAIVVALIMAAALAAVWVAPSQVRAFYAATDEYVAERTNGVEAFQDDTKTTTDEVSQGEAETTTDDPPVV